MGSCSRAVSHVVARVLVSRRGLNAASATSALHPYGQYRKTWDFIILTRNTDERSVPVTGFFITHPPRILPQTRKAFSSIFFLEHASNGLVFEAYVYANRESRKGSGTHLVMLCQLHSLIRRCSPVVASLLQSTPTACLDAPVGIL